MNKKCVFLGLGLLVFLSVCSLFHKHSFTEATCIVPKTCIECGKTQGSVVEHSFTEATCEVAKTCTLCGKTEGEALGHTTEFGKCDTCGTSVNWELYEDIVASFEAVNTYTEQAVAGIGNASYSSCQWSASVLGYAKKQLKEMYELCGDYQELRDLKKCLEETIRAIPTSVASDTKQARADFLDAFKAYITKETAVGLELIEINKKM